MAKLEASVVVNAPIEKVFAFVADPATATQWQAGVIEAGFTSEGPARVGSTYHYVIEMMGRRIETTGEATAYDPPRRYDWKSIKGPFPMSGTNAFESVEGGTRLTTTVEAEVGGFFKLAEPLLMAQQKGQMQSGFKKLKEILEAV